MQTFLPYSDFAKSAGCLDNRRLGKQRVEARQILNILAGKSRGWRNHPAVLMWSGHEKALRQYLRAVILEWKRRGFRNSIRVPRAAELAPDEIPPWIGSRRFHSSHRSNLLQKDSQHYGQFGWRVKLDLPRYWPVRKNGAKLLIYRSNNDVPILAVRPIYQRSHSRASAIEGVSIRKSRPVFR